MQDKAENSNKTWYKDENIEWTIQRGVGVGGGYKNVDGEINYEGSINTENFS